MLNVDDISNFDQVSGVAARNQPAFFGHDSTSGEKHPNTRLNMMAITGEDDDEYQSDFDDEEEPSPLDKFSHTQPSNSPAAKK